MTDRDDRHPPHRFFVDFPLADGQTVELPAEIARQIGRVLRLRPGATITLLDDSGWEYTLELAVVEARRASGRVVARAMNAAEPRAAITLYAAPLKGDGYAYTLQKATEIGAAAFVPIVTARTVVGEAGAGKVERWRRIVREAAEQSGRGRVPTVGAPVPFDAACRMATEAGPALIPWEEERSLGLRAAIATLVSARGPLGALALFIGPEGGFTVEEIATARGHGIAPTTLGPRVLRAETAAAVATALALSATGEMDR